TGEGDGEKSPKVVCKSISKVTSERVMDLLVSVVKSKDGTGKMYKLDDYSVAGKTGTSQIPNPDGLGYLAGHGNHIYSFLGMAPKDDPTLMLYVSVTQPDLETEDGDVAGSIPVPFIFKNVMENSLHYLDIDPGQDSNDSDDRMKNPELTGTNTTEAKKMLTQKGLQVTVAGSVK